MDCRPVTPEVAGSGPVSIATVEHPKTGTSCEGTGVVPDVATSAAAALDAALRVAGA